MQRETEKMLKAAEARARARMKTPPAENPTREQIEAELQERALISHEITGPPIAA